MRRKAVFVLVVFVLLAAGEGSATARSVDVLNDYFSFTCFLPELTMRKGRLLVEINGPCCSVTSDGVLMTVTRAALLQSYPEDCSSRCQVALPGDALFAVFLTVEGGDFETANAIASAMRLQEFGFYLPGQRYVGTQYQPSITAVVGADSGTPGSMTLVFAVPTPSLAATRGSVQGVDPASSPPDLRLAVSGSDPIDLSSVAD